MSDSDEPASLPSDTRIEKALRKTVADTFASGNLEDLTLKRVRKAVARQLLLPQYFLKTSAAWKDRSKTVVNDAVESHENGPQSPPPGPPPTASSSKKGRKPKAASSAKSSVKASQKATTKAMPQKGAKRQSPAAAPKSNKRRKVVAASDSDSDGDEGSAAKAIAKSSAGSDDANDSDEDEAPAKHNPKEISPTDNKAKAEPNPIADAESDSDLSSVIDEVPPKKKGKKKASDADGPKKAPKQKTKPSKEKVDLDPQDAEIKRLQGWLIKCGIRKMWHRELAPYSTPKAKINHLKDMLKDAGMDGRYSVEKARQIKERRELAADLEAVQEGAKRWGQNSEDGDDNDDDDSGAGRSRRKLARGFKNLAFLGDEGEETD